ncbi:lipase 1-like isoform X2 [Musca domestica]|uniref:Lipase n=1 Tax=Musca domestica TaxID=7370 RepID=A0ABM3V719_MUSDO|nr:lipase 1-like isoform X2 [Musca domestica]
MLPLLFLSKPLFLSCWRVVISDNGVLRCYNRCYGFGIEWLQIYKAQLLKKYHYPVEKHFVTTKDNYILGMHRLPRPGAPPIFMMHGLLDSSATWIIMGPQNAPAYYFYDNGYDVWLGNSRGNRYSRNHTTMDPDTDPEFWTFSWHEIGIHDLPAMIDYILQQTGFKKIGYFGHSQGTTTFWVLASMHPEYNEKITMMHALAPVAFMRHVKAPLLGYARSFVKMSEPRIREFMPRKEMLWRTCLASPITEGTCLETYYQVVGKDVETTNTTMFPTIVGHFPAGCNLKQISHYMQLIDSDRFCQFDYGAKENMKRYGKSTPPDYPLEKITANVGLYYTLNDYLSSEVDVKRLAKILPNVVEDSLYPHKKWNHMTMLWGINAREMAHKRMLEVMKNYSYE